MAVTGGRAPAFAEDRRGEDVKEKLERGEEEEERLEDEERLKRYEGEERREVGM